MLVDFGLAYSKTNKHVVGKRYLRSILFLDLMLFNTPLIELRCSLYSYHNNKWIRSTFANSHFQNVYDAQYAFYAH